MKTTLWGTYAGDINANLAFHNNLSGATGAPAVTDDLTKGYEPGSVWIYGGNVWMCTDNTKGAAVWTETQSQLTNPVAGVAAGYKIARGVHQQAAASDTVVTGLATVVAAVASFQSAPTVNQLFATADVGTQAGAPAAGSILLKTFKPTAVNDVTPLAATDFTDNIKLAWIAVGT